MEIEELTEIVSGKSGVEPKAVRKVLESAFAVLGEALLKDEKVEFQGLGTFIRRQNKNSGKMVKALFRSWSEKSPRRKKGNANRSPRKVRRKGQISEQGSSP